MTTTAGDTPMPETDIKSLLRRFITAHGSAWVADCAPHVSDTRLRKVWDNSNAHEKALSDTIDQLEASLTAERMARVKAEKEVANLKLANGEARKTIDRLCEQIGKLDPQFNCAG